MTPCEAFQACSPGMFSWYDLPQDNLVWASFLLGVNFPRATLLKDNIIPYGDLLT